ncbi:ATP-binding protein [Hoeflea poritis]|uniref:Tetratricopeptide repeat protein n=1 Tax=Hoeflea poritis TaxID=2993659 RepID=A0ABT4VL45_9HYPH|nr:tetratricopeptide repeat protein [Hoeflea poritis]MDA4845435.1 tetratricopeptide repeat protein [Hoeflea poritis]
MAYPERSVVTVLVVDAVSSTSRIASVDPDDAQLMVDDVLAHIRHSVERAGGLLVSFAGDGGVAVFGWPDSLEDHADRACEAAWNIQHFTGGDSPILDPEKNEVQFRVGIHSGLVGLRHLELERGSQIDLVGGTVHLAARLEKSAQPGQILLSAETLELCRLDFEHTARPDLAILEEINSTVYQLSAPPKRRRANDALHEYAFPIVGRDMERAILRKSITRNSHAKAAFAIIGEPGIGKSRLAAAAIDEALSQNAVDRLLVYRGDVQKRTTPFAVFRSLILDALKLDEQATQSQIEAAFCDAGFEADGGGALHAILLSDGRSDSAQSGPRLSLKQIAQGLVDIFARLALKDRTLLLLEDLHLVDPESQLCLELLCGGNDGHALYLLLTGRPEAAFDAQQIADTVLRLEPMSRDKMRLLARRLWTKNIPDELDIEKALDQADGIPFVLEQLVCSVDAQGVDPLQSIPQGVQSMIHARLNRLPRAAKHCAQSLSILGEQVELDFARKVLGIGTEELMANLAQLNHLAITRVISGRSVRFCHAIIAEACQNTVPRARRKDIHLTAIDVITATYDDLGGQYERLAYHAEAAGDDRLALEYLSKAARGAMKNYAGKSLQLLFDRALDCIDRIGEPAEEAFVDLTIMVCTTMLQLGEFSKMHDHLPKVLALAKKQNRTNQICAAKCNLGMVDWFEGRYEDGIRTVDEALQMARELDSLPHIFAAQHLLAVLNHAMGNMDEALDFTRDLCQRLSGDLETKRLGAAGIPGAISHAFLGWFLIDIGAYEESLQHAQKALDISRSCKDPYTEVVALNALGRVLIMMERTDEAVACLETTMDLIEQHGYDAPKPHITGLLATALARNGRAEEAIERVDDCFRKALHLRTGRLEIYYLYAGYAEALFRSGAVERCLPAIDQAIEIGRSINNPGLIVQGLAIRAKLAMAIKSDSPLIQPDIDEHRTLCDRHGFKQLV